MKIRAEILLLCTVGCCILFSGCDDDPVPTNGDADVETDAGNDGDHDGDIEPDPLVISTTSGQVRGIQDETTGIYIYRGIPYVAPPTGENRFRPPQPITPSDTVIDATDYGDRCPQHNLFERAPTSEDCLNLNIWSPDLDPETPLPVMIWTYGGGFESGGGSDAMYEGSHIAEEGVILVTFNYRVGALGFLAHEDLTNDSGDYPSSGNYGIQDQTAAIEWVHSNIANFGGDPENVTLFGESAGSVGVCLQLLVPENEGRVHRAILQSGTCGGERPLAEAEQRGVDFVKQTGCASEADVVACLRGLEYRDLLSASPSSSTFIQDGGPYWAPNVDGLVVPENAIDAFENDRIIDADLIIGTNRDEGTIFAALEGGTGLTDDDYHTFTASLGERIDGNPAAIEARYPVGDFEYPSQAIIQIITEGMFICPARRFSRLHAQNGHSVYLYHFYGEFETAILMNLGAFHSGEIPFIFHNPHPLGYLEKEDIPLGEVMQDLWVEFAIKGDPNGAEFPQWPAYDEKTDEHMVLDLSLSSGSGLHSETCDYWDDIYAGIL